MFTRAFVQSVTVLSPFPVVASNS